MQDSTATTIELRTSSYDHELLLNYIFYFIMQPCCLFFWLWPSNGWLTILAACDPKVCKEIKRVTNHTNNNIIALESNWE